jgi:hypothetical protein
VVVVACTAPAAVVANTAAPAAAAAAAAEHSSTAPAAVASWHRIAVCHSCTGGPTAAVTAAAVTAAAVTAAAVTATAVTADVTDPVALSPLLADVQEAERLVAQVVLHSHAQQCSQEAVVAESLCLAEAVEHVH